jgi:hypothetical protein
MQDAQTKRQQDALWWRERLWDVEEGYPLSAKEAQDLIDWFISTYLNGHVALTAKEAQALLNLSESCPNHSRTYKG